MDEVSVRGAVATLGFTPDSLNYMRAPNGRESCVRRVMTRATACVAFGLSAVIFGACLLFVAVRRTAPVVMRRGSLGARVSAAPDWALEEDGRTG
ncbi:hypothetical protein [Kozakia baliensis]|uniref:hypothetical protein n=1 Tax=Kozakia baliensis TaxID=153496 RepID=UPI000494EAF1|nr:hypothetical protein [Kozakia baliensis]